MFSGVPSYHGGLLRGRAQHGLVGLMTMGHVKLTVAQFHAVFPHVYEDFGNGVVPGLRGALRLLLQEKVGRAGAAYPSAADWPPL